MIEAISQVGIVIFGLVAVYLTQEKKEERRRWACVFGLLSQPFWFISAAINYQPGILFISFVYALIWLKGFYTNWVVPYVNRDQTSNRSGL